MKRLFRFLAVLVFLLLLLVAIWFGFLPAAPRGTASVVFLGVTNNAFGQPCALLCFTNASSVGVAGMVHSVDYKSAEGWLTNQPAPGVVTADVASSADLGPHGARVVSVRFPTNAVWRLRIRYHEQPRGPQGVFVRAADLLTALRDRVRPVPVSYTGQSYLVETADIAQ
jgi:hypothetical protein